MTNGREYWLGTPKEPFIEWGEDRLVEELLRLRAALSLPADEADPFTLTERDRWAWGVGYRAGVEAAAKVADTYADEAQTWFRDNSEAKWTTRLATRIRSLAPPSDSRDQGERTCECCTGTEECCRCDDDCATGRARIAAGRDPTDCRPLPSPSADPEVNK